MELQEGDGLMAGSRRRAHWVRGGCGNNGKYASPDHSRVRAGNLR
jgi:hypothetical protein